MESANSWGEHSEGWGEASRGAWRSPRRRAARERGEGVGLGRVQPGDVVLGRDGGVLFIPPQLAEQALTEGKADLIGIARGLLADSEWAKKAKEGRPDEIVACTMCGRCTSVCPANITGKPLSPRKIMVNVRERTETLAMEKGLALVGRAPSSVTRDPSPLDSPLLLDGFISEDELWSCTSCRACVQECPVSIDQLSVINEMRRTLVLGESRFPEEIMPAFESMEQRGSPWAFDPSDRARWADGMDIPTMAEMAARGEKPDVLYWVGCMGSFDERTKQTTVAFAKIMKAAGVRFAILGQEEKCHGDPARRMGNEYLYQMLAKDAVGVLNTSIDFVLFTVLVNGAGWAPVPANIVSYGTGIVNSFVVNKFWTFRDSTPLARSAAPFARFLARLPDDVMVVVDEAYIEFGGQSFLPDLPNYPNVLVGRTFSKAYGLAGLRVGYALAHPSVADIMNRVRQPFNANSIALAAAIPALRSSAPSAGPTT